MERVVRSLLGVFFFVGLFTSCSRDSGSPEGRVELVPSEIDFGTVVSGQTTVRQVVIRNRTRAPFLLGRVQSDGPLKDALEISAPSGTRIPEGGSLELGLSLTLQQTGLQVGQLHVYADGEDAPIVSAAVRATGVTSDAGVDGGADGGEILPDAGGEAGPDAGPDAGVEPPCLDPTFRLQAPFVVSSTSSHQRQVRLAYGGGRFLAVWSSDSDVGDQEDGGDDDIFYSWSMNGTQWEPARPLAAWFETDLHPDHWPDLTTDGQGNWVIVWQHVIGGEQMEADLMASRSSDHGTTWSEPQTLARLHWADDAVPRVATDEAGTWVVVWHTHDGPGLADGDIVFSRSTDRGETWLPVAQPIHGDVLTDIGDDYFPAVAASGEGNFMVVWESEVATVNGIDIEDDSDTLWARSVDGARTFSRPTPVFQWAATDGNTDDGAPDVQTDLAGGFFMVTQNHDSEKLILGSRFPAEGSEWGQQRFVARGSTFFPDVRLVPDGYGRWLFVWETYELFGGDSDILMSLSQDDGLTWSDPALIDLAGAADRIDEVGPSLTTDRAGTWVAAWTTQIPPDRIRIATASCE